MKILNGVPQFEYPELLHDSLRVANEQLREWAEARRCVNCLHFENIEGGCCWNFCMWFVNENVKPEQFSCAAFEAKK